MINEIAVCVLLLAALMLGGEVGYRMGLGKGEGSGASQVGTIQAAMLGLLALLLGFSFAVTTNLFLERQDFITAEANAIGTSYLRADLLEEPHRSELKSALRQYVDKRLEHSEMLKTTPWTPEMQATVGEGQVEIWTAAIRGVGQKPELVLSVLPPVNDVIDLHTTRLISGSKHLPWLVKVLLIACSLLSLGAIGYGSGMTGRRNFPLLLCLSFLIASTLWLIIDMDHPRSGIVQLSDMPLRMLQADIKGGK